MKTDGRRTEQKDGSRFTLIYRRTASLWGPLGGVHLGGPLGGPTGGAHWGSPLWEPGGHVRLRCLQAKR